MSQCRENPEGSGACMRESGITKVDDGTVFFFKDLKSLKIDKWNLDSSLGRNRWYTKELQSDIFDRVEYHTLLVIVSVYVQYLFMCTNYQKKKKSFHVYL